MIIPSTNFFFDYLITVNLRYDPSNNGCQEKHIFLCANGECITERELQQAGTMTIYSWGQRPSVCHLAMIRHICPLTLDADTAR